MIVHAQTFETRLRMSVADYAVEVDKFDFYQSRSLDMDRVASRCQQIVLKHKMFDEDRRYEMCYEQKDLYYVHRKINQNMFLVAAIQKLPSTQLHEILIMFDSLADVVIDSIEAGASARFSQELILTLKEAMQQLNPPVMKRDTYDIEMTAVDDESSQNDTMNLLKYQQKEVSILWRLARVLNLVSVQ